MTVETLQHAVCTPRILITGLPGVGKTTLFHALAEHLADFKRRDSTPKKSGTSRKSEKAFGSSHSVVANWSCPTSTTLGLTVSAAMELMSPGSSTSWLSSTSGMLSRR